MPEHARGGEEGERGDLLEQGDGVAVADAAGPPAAPEPRAPRLGRPLDRIVLLPVEPLDPRPGVRRLHHPGDGLAPLVRRPVHEYRHQRLGSGKRICVAGMGRPPYSSSWVTRKTSSMVVTPSLALAQEEE